MPDQQHLAIGRLLELSDLMLDKASHGLWDAVFELQNKRDLLIHEFFAQTHDRDVQSIRDGIQSMLESNAKLADMVIAEKQAIQKQMREVRQNKEAARAYNATHELSSPLQNEFQHQLAAKISQQK